MIRGINVAENRRRMGVLKIVKKRFQSFIATTARVCECDDVVKKIYINYRQGPSER